MGTVSYTHLDVYKRQVLQNKNSPDPRTFIGEGKAEEEIGRAHV